MAIWRRRLPHQLWIGALPGGLIVGGTAGLLGHGLVAHADPSVRVVSVGTTRANLRDLAARFEVVQN
jgi:hypothetical protein